MTDLVREATTLVPTAHAAAAFGTFTVTHDITALCRAGLFAAIGRQTAVLARFAVLPGDADDAARDTRGFALKFYTDEGNWDLVGNNSPVYFLRDPAKFPDLMRARAADPATGRRSAAAFWDFLSRTPESLHQVTILFGDRGLPASPRFMHGYGSHTFCVWNAHGARHWVKFHFRTSQGLRAAADAEGARLGWGGDLAAAIDGGDCPAWTLFVQIMPEAAAGGLGFDPFDVTKVWPQRAFPLHAVGRLVLDRNPRTEADLDEAAFSPANVVPGIGLSPDRMLQARIFAYAEAHRRRLGAQYALLPVNAPRAPVRGYAARVGAAADAPVAVAAAGGDDFAQPRVLFRLLDVDARGRLCGTIAAALRDVPGEVVARQMALFRAVDAAYADGVAAALAGLR